jgi:hypothetical protein
MQKDSLMGKDVASSISYAEKPGALRGRMAEKEVVLKLDQLLSGDRPSLLVMGMVVSQALKKHGVAVISSNALGDVVVLPPEAAPLLAKPLVKDEDLDRLSEDEAITIMASEGREDADILEYLAKRKG